MNQQGVITRFFVWLLGANWKTTLYGTLTAIGTGTVSLTVALNQAATPTGINDQDPIVAALLYAIPARWRFWITLCGGAITLFFGNRFAKQAKSKDVTGGSTQQTLEGNVAAPGDQKLVDATVLASPPEEQAKIPAPILSDIKANQ